MNDKSLNIIRGLELPEVFDKLVPALYENGFTCFDFGTIFYVINKGQTGIGKVCAVFTDYDQAKKYLDDMDPDMKPHTEVRVGLMIEGYPLD